MKEREKRSGERRGETDGSKGKRQVGGRMCKLSDNTPRMWIMATATPARVIISLSQPRRPCTPVESYVIVTVFRALLLGTKATSPASMIVGEQVEGEDGGRRERDRNEEIE